MSKRAEEAALKAYPKEEGKLWSSAFGMFEFDKTAPERTAYQKGYEQAEKDLALTWEDMKKIAMISVELSRERFDNFYIHKTISDEQHFTEVLRRFNEQRKK